MDKMKLIDEEFVKMVNILQAENADLAMVKKRKEDFAHFVSHTLQNSMLTGIPQIAQAKDWSKRVIRSLVFLFCIAGFIYQSYSFMSIYWEYDVVMDVQVTNPFYTELPAITICHKRGIKADDLCRDNSTQNVRDAGNVYCISIKEVMEIYDDLSCKCNPRLCDENGTVHDYMWVTPPRRADGIPFDLIQPWIFTTREVAFACRFKNWQTRGGELPEFCNRPEYVKQTQCASTGEREACATYFSKYGDPNKTFPEISSETELIIGTQRHDKYMDENGEVNPIYASIHDPRTIVNPFKDGFELLPSKKYIVRINKVDKKLLPAPYKTDCVDYHSMWKARGGKGPLNLKECLIECQVNKSLELHGCVIVGIYYVGEAPRCLAGVEYGKEKDLQYIIESGNEYSKKVCRPACEESKYITDITVRALDNLAPCSGSKSKAIALTLDFQGMEVTRYSYTPKYQDIETFSYVGGYVGMWLGISLVAVFDFLETVFVMMKYPLRRFRKFRNKRQIQNQIIHGHLHH